MAAGRGDSELQNDADNRAEFKISADATTLRFRFEGQLITWSRARAYAPMGGFNVPAWVSQQRHGQGEPDMFVKVAVRDGSPEVVELSFISQPGQTEVRQKHLRAIDLHALATDLYTYEVSDADDDVPLSDYAERLAAKFIERQRLPREYRVINDDFLKEVAQVYRANVDNRAPTKAVAKRFGVKERMAGTYVERARRKGFLPPTKQGQKKA
ncbi:hypothetical protein ACRU44_17015 [Mycobacterium colombiense]